MNELPASRSMQKETTEDARSRAEVKVSILVVYYIFGLFDLIGLLPDWSLWGERK